MWIRIIHLYQPNKDSSVEAYQEVLQPELMYKNASKK